MHTTARHTPPITTFTSTLVAARLAEDGTIELRVVDPAEPAASILVRLPKGGAAYARFVAQIGRPPFEGPMLLYGAARLTIADRPATARSFDALDEAPACLAPGGAPTRLRAVAA